MSEQELREFEENIVKGAHVAFQRLVTQKKKDFLFSNISKKHFNAEEAIHARVASFLSPGRCL